VVRSYAVHHALRARFCIERGRYWQAQYWVSAVRDYALSLACRRRGLPGITGAGSTSFLAMCGRSLSALPRSLDREELRRSLSCAIDLLLGETVEVQELAERVRPQLLQLAEVALA
jgi:hypothetical protein